MAHRCLIRQPRAVAQALAQSGLEGACLSRWYSDDRQDGGPGAGVPGPVGRGRGRGTLLSRVPGPSAPGAPPGEQATPSRSPPGAPRPPEVRPPRQPRDMQPPQSRPPGTSGMRPQGPASQGYTHGAPGTPGMRPQGPASQGYTHGPPGTPGVRPQGPGPRGDMYGSPGTGRGAPGLGPDRSPEVPPFGTNQEPSSAGRGAPFAPQGSPPMRGRGGPGELRDASERGAGPRLPPGVRLPQRTMERSGTVGQMFPRPGPRQRQDGRGRGDRAPRGPGAGGGLEEPELDFSGDDDDERRRVRRAHERRRREQEAREALAAGGRDRRTEQGRRGGKGGPEGAQRRAPRNFDEGEAMQDRDPDALAQQQEEFFESLKAGLGDQEITATTTLEPKDPSICRQFDLEVKDLRSILMMELDPNMQLDVLETPDPSLRGPPDLKEAMEDLKPFFVREFGIESEEEWQVVTNGSVEFVEAQAKRLGYHNYRMEEAQLLQRAEELFPEGHEFRGPALQAMRALTANPTWSGEQKAKFLDTLQEEFVLLKEAAGDRSITTDSP